MSAINLVDINQKLSAEEFSDDDFEQYHRFSETDGKILRRLMAPGPVLLRGPRGSGKSAYMREAHKIIRESRGTVVSVYISLRYFPLIISRSENYLGTLIPYVGRHIEDEFKNLGFSVDLKISSIEDINGVLNNLCVKFDKRLVIFFDDVAHIGREISLAGFFDFFRTISSSTVSCKASIYPGVTKFGSRFDLYSDATVVEAQRDERSRDFSSFFRELIEVRHPGLMDRCEARLQPLIPMLIGRAVLGNIRAFNAFCEELAEKGDRITVYTVADALKWLASGYLYPALEELQTKLGAYTPMLDTAEKIAPVFFDECGRKRVNSMLVHRDNVQRLGKIFEILEYTGLIAKREASRSLSKSGSGRGPRYALSLGPLFEQVPGGTLSYELIEELTRISVLNSEMVEYSPSSFLSQYDCPTPEEDESLDVIDLPIEKLKAGTALPYGLTQIMIDSLKEYGWRKISDIAPLSVNELRAVPNIGKAKAERIKSAVEQAIWM
ncbi:hypothetical protein [Acidovorax radicis]|uniref:hypothetical protein n=1 Tax=Acidovorax radicis TaxID=758826 RepID=UPI000300F5A2|nr:hypothetical protein [Acidovorax radicis]